MGKKKKGGNKMAKMSDDERLRYLQARADVEEEARRRKQQLIALYMKNKLKREDAFTRLNIAKINQEWRSILRQLKCDELRSEIRCAEELCKLSIDRKNQIIQRLLSDLSDSEEMYSTNLQSHSQNVLKLTAIHKERLKFWSEFYAREKAILLKDFRGDIGIDKLSFEQSKGELESFYYALDEEIQRDRTKNRLQAQKRYDGFKDMMTIRLELVTKSREGVMESLWHEFQVVLNNYTAYTKDFYEDYLELRRRDEIETQLNQSHYRDIAKCTDVIADLKLEINSKRNTHQMNRTHLLEVKKELQAEYTKLKTEFNHFRSVDKTKIRDLVTCANNAKKVLEGLHKKGSSLMQLAAICRKYETDGQKYSVLQKSHADSSLQLPKEKDNDFQALTYKNFAQLGQFWDRYNKVRLDCACLIEERAALQQDNNRLKMRLRHYLVDISMQNTSGDRTNRVGQRPKSMTIEKVECIDLGGHRAKTAQRQGHRYRPVTCIEGNLSVAIRSQKLLQARLDN